MELRLAVDRGGARRQLGVAKIAHEAAEELLFGGEGEVHGGLLVMCQ